MLYERGLKEYEKWQSMAETYKEKASSRI